MRAGRVKRSLGDLFGLTNFGGNITVVAPCAVSALRHAHLKQDEFVYVVSGCVVLYTDEGRTKLFGGICADFKAGDAEGHRCINESTSEAVYAELGGRAISDEVSYPLRAFSPAPTKALGSSFTMTVNRMNGVVRTST